MTLAAFEGEVSKRLYLPIYCTLVLYRVLENISRLICNHVALITCISNKLECCVECK